MFASKKLSLNEWKNWAIGLVGNTMSSIDQATSRWFWNLINGLPRDYFAKTFDQVNYLDKRVWEGMFRANIEEIKEQLELGVSESIVEANLVKLQGLVGKYSLSPVTYEDGLKELEDFISTFGNGDNYLKILREVRNEFREELKSQPVLLKECIESEVNLERKEGAYYKSLLDDRSLKNTSPERVISESPILDNAAVSKRGNNNYKLRNISKLLFSNPGQALTLFLAAQSAFASAANIQVSNSTGLAIGNDTLSFDNNLSNLSEFEGRINENVSLHSISKSSNFRNSNKVRKEVEVVERDLNGRFIEIRDEFKDLRDTGELVEVLTYVKSQRSKRSANESLSEMETVPEDQGEVIVGLENTVRELKKEIEKIKNSSFASDKRYKERISSLEGQLIVLQRSFDDMKRQSNQTLSEKANEIKGLSAIVKNLRKQVEDLNKKIQEDERKYLYVECAKDIQARKFKDAEKKLAQINNETEIYNIVKQVYSGRINNFSLLLEFAGSIGDIKLKFLFYRALDYELSETHDDDIIKLIELAENVKWKVINQANASFNVKPSDLLDSLKDRIKNIAVELLSNAIENKTYNKENRNVAEISNQVNQLESRLFVNIMRGVVDKVYDKVDIEEILKFQEINSYIEQDIAGCIALFEKMERKGHLRSSTSLRLASAIKTAITETNYKNVNLEARANLEELRNKLPGSISAIAFASEVCIKNNLYNEYLYAASDGFNYDGERRSVFTWANGKKVLQGNWEIGVKGEYFSLKNTQHNEYLFASAFNYEQYKCDEDVPPLHAGRYRLCKYNRYYAFTWIPGDKVNNCYWEFLYDQNQDSVMIKNVFNGNLLFSSSLRYTDSRRRVLTANEVINSRDLWKIEDCSNESRRRRDVEEVQDVGNSTVELLQDNVEPSTRVSDITLERVKTKDKNISFTGK